MTDIFVVGKRMPSSYDIDFEMGEFFLRIKYDTGAKSTVISAGALDDTLTQDKKERILEYCEKQECDKAQLISASGHPFWGYLVKADRVRIGSSRFHAFYFYLIVKNERDIALLGFDFIDKTKRIAEPCGNYILSQFDEAAYMRSQQKPAIDGNDLLEFMRSLSDM